MQAEREAACDDLAFKALGATERSAYADTVVEMAARLAKYFGSSEQFWLNLQDAFAVHQVRRKYSKELNAIQPLPRAMAR